MRMLLPLFLLVLPLLSEEVSFITQGEYAAQLYKAPRGIGCHKCHGDKGEGRVIAKYKDKGESKSFNAPAINVLSYENFSDALQKRQAGMPRYFLTDEEIKALYFYLQPPKERQDADQEL